MIELSRNGERKQERGQVNLDEPQLLKKLLEMYKVEYGHTDAELSSYLHISMDKLYSLKEAHNGNKLKIML